MIAWERGDSVRQRIRSWFPMARALRDALAAAITRDHQLRETRHAMEAHAEELARANTDLQREIAERRRVEAGLHFLVEASAELSTVLDYEVALMEVARLAVPRVADYCIVDMIQEDQSLRQVAVVHVNPEKEELVRDLRRLAPFDPTLPYGVAKVLQDGRPELVPEIRDRLWITRLDDSDYVATVRKLAPCSYMIVPLVARGRTLGAVSFISAESGHHYGDHDLSVAMELTGRAALAIDNARLYEEAQTAIRVRELFLSVAAHELRTPLTSLLGYAQIMERRVARSNVVGEREQLTLTVITTQARRINRQIESLLDLSRLQRGDFTVEAQPVDLCDVVRRAVEQIEPSLDRHTIALECACEAITILGDDLRLDQVLHNLLHNAIKYSPDGGLVRVCLAADTDFATLTVTDQGIGIPEAERPHLFERFYRAANIDPRQISGMGIGLYVVHEIVTRHGGRIEVAGDEGAGSSFTVWLPRAGQQAVV